MNWPYAEADTVAREEIERRLAATARRRDLITYADLVRGVTFRLPNVAQGQPLQLGVPEWSDLHSAILRDFLNRISCDSYLRSGILTSAVAVRQVTGEPGDGFKGLVDRLGLAPSRSDEFVLFWSNQVKKTYDWYASMETGLPTGDFTCPITFESVRPPRPVVKEEGGVTYVVQGDYEIAFQTVLRFASGTELSIRAKLFGENSQKVVVRDRDGRPAALSGYTQGRSEILDMDGNVIFEGRYYDTRTYYPLTGDDALTPTGIRICDHWINGFGRRAYAGHAFSLGVHLTREHEPAFRGQAHGRID